LEAGHGVTSVLAAATLYVVLVAGFAIGVTASAFVLLGLGEWVGSDA